MGFVNWFKDVLGVRPDDYDYEDDDLGIMTEDYEKKSDYQTTNKYDNVVTMNTTTQVKVVLVKPEKYDDSLSIADHLNEGHTIVLNLESASPDIARRLLDFLGGVAYANRGKIKRVSKRTFIITPDSVDIMGDLIDELESSGVFY